jgi:hypothetical protein
MRLVVSLFTAVCFIAAAEASTTGVATPQPSAPKPSTIDIIRQPSLLRQKLAGNCTTTCQWIGGRQFCNTHCFQRNRTFCRPLRQPAPSLGNPWEGICFRVLLRPPFGGRFGRYAPLFTPALGDDRQPWDSRGGREGSEGRVGSDHRIYSKWTVVPLRNNSSRNI